MSRFRHDLTQLKGAEQLEAAKHRVAEKLQEIGVLDGLSKPIGAASRNESSGPPGSTNTEIES